MARWRKPRVMPSSVAVATPVVSTRRMLPSLDVRRLCDISQGASDSPLYVQDFRRLFADPTHGGTVAVAEDRVIGYATYQIDGRDIILSDFTVDVGYRRIGAGRALIASLLAECPASFDGSRFLSAVPGRLLIYCHEELMRFQLFLHACGVPAVKVHRGYFATDRRDCFVFAKARG